MQKSQFSQTKLPDLILFWDLGKNGCTRSWNKIRSEKIDSPIKEISDDNNDNKNYNNFYICIKINLIYRRISAGRKPLPFKKEALECPASEGCSLHDLMNHFLRDEMAIQTPVTTLPEIMHISYAMYRTKSYEFRQMAFDLNCTKRDVLVMEGMNPSKCLAGHFWLAARHVICGSPPSPDNNSPDDMCNNKTGDTTIDPSMTQIENINNKR